MPNMSLKKVTMPEELPEVRNTNFNEVSKGYDEKMAIEEAQRCIHCKNTPCVQGCPVNVHIPDFIAKIEQGDFLGAYETIKETNSLPAICGRVCPQESQCEGLCTRGRKGEPVGIGRLERFSADYAISHTQDEKKTIQQNGKKIAIIGAGPAGLSCAGSLAQKGFDVTVFEAFHKPGGVLVYGIPEFRLPKDIVKKEIDALIEMGVTIKTDYVIGKLKSIDELMEEGFEAVFIGTGAGLPSFMKIEGENLNGVYSANEYLTRINLMKAYEFPNSDTPVIRSKKVAVIGGGNVAMDAARCAKRLGAEEVSIIYRRSEEEMPARAEEVHHAKEEGIQFQFLMNPTRILGTQDGWVKQIECIQMELTEKDASGRRRPVPIKGSERLIDVDTVIVAIGQSPNPLIRKTTPDLKTQSWGGIIVDEVTGKTSKNHVYAGGDAVTGAATVILAMGAGKAAADAIEKSLLN